MERVGYRHMLGIKTREFHGLNVLYHLHEFYENILLDLEEPVVRSTERKSCCVR